MSKRFKIARKPGQGITETTALGASDASAERPRPRRTRSVEPALSAQPVIAAVTPGLTTRKTIEIPEDYFYRVKMRALERHILEKELWGEIVREYFENHPTL
jgi:hypothetical protein